MLKAMDNQGRLKMKKVRKISTIILIVGLIAALFSGCGSATKSAGSTTKAKYQKALASLVSADIISQEQSDKVLVALMSTQSSSSSSSSQFGGGSRSGGSGQYSGGGGQYSGGGSSQYSGGSSSKKSSSSITTYNLSGLVRTGVITERQSAAIIKAIKDISGSSKSSKNTEEMPNYQGGQGGQAIVFEIICRFFNSSF